MKLSAQNSIQAKKWLKTYIITGSSNAIKKVGPFYIFAATILLLSVAVGLNRIFYTDFYPLNGDFQNFNVYRRILNGQIPYVDFANYLGIGTIAINTPLLYFFPNFTSSILITNTSSFALFCISIYIFLRASNIKYSTAIILTCGVPLAIVLSPIIAAITPTIYSPGASMRMTRCFLPFALSAGYLLGKKATKKVDEDFFGMLSKKRVFAYIGILLGLTLTWSNDFGPASFACFVLLSIIVQIFWLKTDFKKILTRLLTLAVFSSLGLLCSLVIITRGHPMAFINESRGIAAYQFWYYDDLRILQLLDFRFVSPLFRLLLLLCLFTIARFIIQLYRKKVTENLVVITFLYCSIFAGAMVYTLGGGGYLNDPIELAIFLFVISLIGIYGTKLLSLLKVDFPHFASGAVWCFFLISASLAGYELHNLHSRTQTHLLSTPSDRHNPDELWEWASNPPKVPTPVYVPELGGYVHFGTSLINAKKRIGTNPIFSTYASALEVMLGQFQPSGYDYILHVLGDSVRIKYLKDFEEGKFPYCQTVRDDFTINEAWAQRENWFFYRELYDHYIPSFLTDYGVIWQRTPSSNKIPNACKSWIQTESTHSARVVVNCNDTLTGIADMNLSYSSKKRMNLWGLQTFRQIIVVTDSSMLRLNNKGFHSYYLPNQGIQVQIPIWVKNGKGEIRITSTPERGSELRVQSTDVVSFFPDFPAISMKLHG